MTHLRVEQNTITENVTSNVIHKLYETAKAIIDAEEANDVQESLVSLKGNLLVPISYRAEVTWLLTKFPDLHITSADYAMLFEDPNMLSYLLSLGVGSNGMIAESLAAAATVVANSLNTTVTKFNELKYFTNVTSSKNGYAGSTSGNIKFIGWTALKEVDISNFVSIGHSSAYGLEDTFLNCTSLKTVTASSKLKNIGYSAFRGCTNLEYISGLSGVITIDTGAFANDSKLENRTFSNVEIDLHTTSGGSGGAFERCSLLEELLLSALCTTIPSNTFKNCTNLATINLSNVTSIESEAFAGCTSLTSVDLSRCTTFGSKPFEGCTNLTTITLSNSLTTLPAYALSGCTGLTTINGGSNIASYGEGALENCSSLTTTIDLSNTTSIASKAFKGCSNITFTNMDKVSEIGTYCFQGCNAITNAEFKDGVIIHFDSFWGLTGLQSIRFKGAGTIEPSAFRGCSNLTSITFDGDVALGAMCFAECNSLLSVDLSNISEASLFYNFSGIGSQFSYCPSLTSAILNPNITKLPPYIFLGCGGSSGFSITIPSGVTEIGNECFYGTSARLTVLATTPPTVSHANTLASVYSIKVPAGTLSAYQSAPYWSDKASVITELAS